MFYIVPSKLDSSDQQLRPVGFGCTLFGEAARGWRQG